MCLSPVSVGLADGDRGSVRVESVSDITGECADTSDLSSVGA